MVNQVSKRSGYLRLQHVLTFPFIIVISIAVLVTGFYSWHYGEESALGLGKQISQQCAHRVEERLTHYLSHAHIVNDSFRQVVKTSLIDPNNEESLKHYLAHISKDNANVRTIGYGYPNGNYFGVGYEKKGLLVYKKAAIETDRVFITTDVVTDKVISERPNYDARKRPWFAEASATNQPIWSSVYKMFSSNQLGVSLSEAIYSDTGHLKGVISTDVVFDNLDEKLKEIRITDNSTILIVDNDKNMIASSDFEKGKTAELSKITNSDNELYRVVADYIYSKNKLEKVIHGSATLTVNQKQVDYFINYIPYKHNGLNWGIILLTPESEFLGNVEKIKENTLLVWGIGFIVALLIGLFITAFVNGSIQKLKKGVKKIQQNENKQIDDAVHHIKEVNDLSLAFKTMAQRLQDTFKEVKQSNEMLEQTVADRTQELQEVNVRLEKLSHTDELTNLANRRKLETKCESFWQDLKDGNIKNIGILMCDIDCFKQYNDRHGHQDGDECLRQVSYLLQSAVSSEDLVARYGGEEFIIILNDADIEKTIKTAEKIQTKLANAAIPHVTSVVSDFITISMGVAVTDDSNVTQAELLTMADKALYEAKNTGRNRFVLYSDGLSNYKTE